MSDKNAGGVSHSQKTGQLVKLRITIKTSSHHETNPPEIQCRIQNQGRP